MSQYYYIKVGGIHEEDYDGWLNLCKKLKTMGLLDDSAIALEYDAEAEGAFRFIFEAVKRNDPDPERYIGD